MRSRKLTDQERIAAVRAYLAGDGSYQSIADQYHISVRTLRDLVALCESEGEISILSYSAPIHYTDELKAAAVQAYLSGEGSQREICLRFHIRSRSQLRAWVRQSQNDAPAPRASSAAENPMRGRRTSFHERVDIVSFCIAHHYDYERTIQHYCISRQQIRHWVQKYQRNGVEGLRDGRGHRILAPMPQHERLDAENKLLQAEITHLSAVNQALKKFKIRERRWE